MVERWSSRYLPVTVPDGTFSREIRVSVRADVELVASCPASRPKTAADARRRRTDASSKNSCWTFPARKDPASRP